ncbi:SsgA family sporulation/cell division regulator [Streptomyces sp. NPDC016845]|uniref:SsgA family sporulation/cell division regulator n=1 Tax=Streptomyces sp. NPDC016845 TaxID=3364972 RepID=UPI00379DDCA9
MEQRLPAVTRSTTARVSAPKGPMVPISASLHYRASDPFAVGLSLGPPSGPPVTWVFSRDLLSDGTTCPAGAGDVRVVPGEECLRVVLTNPGGTALVELSTVAVTTFLRQTFVLVPEGSESDYLDLDSAITLLTENH